MALNASKSTEYAINTEIKRETQAQNNYKIVYLLNRDDSDSCCAKG